MLKKFCSYCMNYKFTLVVVILILTAILMPGESVPEVGISGIDKIVHFGMFFTLTLVFHMEYFKNKGQLPVGIYTFVTLFIFAGSTEVMQLFASNRSMDGMDLCADTIGIVVSMLLVINVLKRINKYKCIKKNK